MNHLSDGSTIQTLVPASYYRTVKLTMPFIQHISLGNFNNKYFQKTIIR